MNFEQTSSSAPMSFSGLPGQSRLVWHPSVHELFDEACYYYLLSGEQGQGRSIIQGLDNLFRRLNILSGSMHVVFGPYDVLLRVWLTRQARVQLLRSLKHPRSDISIGSLQEFTVEDIEYRWEGAEVSPILRDADRTRIEQAAQAIASERTDDADRMAQISIMVETHRLLVHTPAVGQKVYVFLRGRDTRIGHSAELVAETLGDVAEGVGMDSIAVHSGVGFCDFIVSGVVSNYEECLPAVEAIQSSAAQLRLVAWSLVPADYASRPQGESLKAAIDTVPEDVLRILGEVRDPAILREEIASLPVSQRNALQNLFRDQQASMIPRDFERFRELLAHSIAGDRKEMNRALSFLTSIEGDLRWVIPRIAARSLGKDWLGVIRQDPWAGKFVEERNLDTSESPEEPAERSRSLLERWTLSELLQLLHVLTRRWPDVTQEIMGYLDSDILSKHRELQDLRNLFAHGRLVEESLNRSYAGPWGERLRQIAGAISFQIALEAYREKLSGGEW